MKTLKKRRQFLAVSGHQKWVAPGFILQRGEAPASGAGPFFGFVVTRKLGGAVVRNRIRRRLKEAIRGLLKDAFPVRDGHYVCVARKGAEQLDFTTLVGQLKRAFGFLRRDPLENQLPRKAPSTKERGEHAPST